MCLCVYVFQLSLGADSTFYDYIEQLPTVEAEALDKSMGKQSKEEIK